MLVDPIAGDLSLDGRASMRAAFDADAEDRGHASLSVLQVWREGAGTACVFVDEAQFLTPAQVWHLARVADDLADRGFAASALHGDMAQVARELADGQEVRAQALLEDEAREAEEYRERLRTLDEGDR